MKQRLALLLAAAMLFGVLGACSTGGGDSTTASTQSGTTASTGTTTAASTSGQPQDSNRIKDFVTYQTISNEMETFNPQYSQNSKETRVIANMIEALLTNNNAGDLIPAAAESWSTNNGGKTWTFIIRPGITWVDYKGNYKADCVASDWVYGLEWILNYWKNASSNTTQPTAMIQGARDYYNYTKGYAEDAGADEIAAFEALCTKYGLPTTPLTEAEGRALDLTIFSQIVGVSAPDDSTLIYECTDALPYFPTLTCNNSLFPVSKQLLDELGVEGYLAVTHQTLWYTGCYTMTTYVQNNEKVLTRNESYWDKDCTLFDTVTIKMVESADVAYQLYQSGEIDHVDLGESNVQTISNNPSNPYHDQLTEARPTKYAYAIHFAYNKNMETGEPDTNWNLAVANEAFRLAWYYGLDTTAYLGRVNAINPIKCAAYTYTAGSVCLTSDGKDYTQLVRERLGIEIDPNGIATYNPAFFARYKEQAMSELAAKGVTFPVEADYYIISGNQSALDTATVLKHTISQCLGDDFVVMNIKTYVSSVSKEVTTPQLGSFYIGGWGADFGDPVNFMSQETYGEDNAYYSVTYSKINYASDPDLIATYQTFTSMVQAANAVVNNPDDRYNAFADAEAYFIQHALAIPLYVNITWQLTHVNDYSKIYAPYGNQIHKYKNWVTSVDAYTTEDYARLEAEYNANR